MAKREFKRLKSKFLDPQILDTTARMVLEFLSAEGTKGAVGGGFAMQIYGSPRLTGDVDLVVEALPQGEAPFKPGEALTFGGRQYKTAKGVEVDLITRTDAFKALYDEALEKSILTDKDLPVLAPEYLAVAKFVAGRPKDEGDLIWLLQQDDLVNREETLEIAERLVGGQFARNSLQSFIEEADWKSAREQ